MSNKIDVGGKYDKFARWYDLVEGIGEFFLIGGLRSEIFGQAGGKVLEVGVGTGKNLSYYPETCEVTAVDFSEGMLDIARKKALCLKRDIEFRNANTEQLPFLEDSFDTVVDGLCLCTYENPKKALREMARVCKPDGKILLLEHGRSSNDTIARYQERRAEKRARFLGCYRNRDPLQLVRGSGLNVTEQSRSFFGMLHQIVAHP